jgi:hypothetical protein
MKAAEQLETSEYPGAIRTLTDLRSQHPNAIEPQVGLALTAWPQGAGVVVAKLLALQKAHPDQPLVALQLGIVRLAIGERPAGFAALHAARSSARSMPGQEDVARRADDLLHPALAPGYPPLLAMGSRTGSPTAQQAIDRLARLVAAGRRTEAATYAKSLPADRDPGLTAAAAIASYDKDHPAVTLRALQRAVRADPTYAWAHMELAFVQLWSGDRTGGLSSMHRARKLDPNGKVGAQAQAVLDRITD